METVANHFVHRTAADRYERDRPYFHPRVIALIRERLQLAQPLALALDVGCGTGASARALRPIAGRVFATDISDAMLAAAPPTDGIIYARSPAESLPFGPDSFPLLTVSLAFHWLDRPRFLAEAARVLAPGGWLVLYGYHHTRRLLGAAGFPPWFENIFLHRYPQTARHGTPVNEAELASHGLMLRDRTEFTETRPFKLADFTRYLTTHSNVIQAVEGGGESSESASAWITAGLEPFFRDSPQRHCEFSAWISWVQKPSA